MGHCIHKLRTAILAAAALAVIQALPEGRAEPPPDARVTAFFDSACEQAVLHALKDARREILMAAFVLTREDIVDALLAAAQNDIAVQLRYDAAQSDFEGMEKALRRLRRGGVRCAAVRMAGENAAMHHKFVVVDGAVVLTGSYNFTTAASTLNHENLVRIESPAIAQQFRAVFFALVAKDKQ